MILHKDRPAGLVRMRGMAWGALTLIFTLGMAGCGGIDVEEGSSVPAKLIAKWYTDPAAAAGGTGTPAFEIMEDGLYEGEKKLYDISVNEATISFTSTKDGDNMGSVRYILIGSVLNFLAQDGEAGGYFSSLPYYKEGYLQGSSASIPAALLGNWYTAATALPAELAFAIKDGGLYKNGIRPFDLSVRGPTISFLMGGQMVGSADYSVIGNILRVSNVRGTLEFTRQFPQIDYYCPIIPASLIAKWYDTQAKANAAVPGTEIFEIRREGIYGPSGGLHFEFTVSGALTITLTAETTPMGALTATAPTSSEPTKLILEIGTAGAGAEVLGSSAGIDYYKKAP